MATASSPASDPEFQHLEASLYWELRRWLLNLALLPAASFGYLRSFPVLVLGNLPPQPSLGETLLGIAGWLVGINLAYSLVHPLERLLGARPGPIWRPFGRELVFFLLTTVAVALTAWGTRRLSGWSD